MDLGIVYKNDKIINHRSLFKVLINPICRYFGFCFGTMFDGNKLGSIKIMKCDKEPIKWEFKHTDYDKIIKKRILI